MIVFLFLERILLKKASDAWKYVWTVSVMCIIALIISGFECDIGKSELILVGTIFLLLFLYVTTHYVINKLL